MSLVASAIVALGTAAPAFAEDTPVTFVVTGGSLGISVPGPANLGTVTSTGSAQTLTTPLGNG
jgi:hypothetical protein